MIQLRGRLKIAIMAGASVALLAAAAQAETLNDAVLRGLGQRPDVRAAEARVGEATMEVEMAGNGRLPTISASAGPAAAGLGYDLALTQTVYDFGQVRGAIDQSRAVLAREQANLEVARDNAALEIIETYFDVASASAQISLTDEHLTRLNALVEMAQARVEGRYADESESARVALAQATAQGSRARLQGDLEQARDRYALYTGQPPAGVRLPESLDVIRTVADAGALDAAIAASPLYRKASMDVQAADAGVREALASRWPRVNLEASMQRREIGGRMVDDTAIAVRMRVGSQSGFSAWQRPRLEAQRREAARWQAETVGVEIQRVVRALVRTHQTLKLRIDALAVQVEQGQALRDLYREQFLVGRRDIQDLVLMETESFEAERQIMELTIERERIQYRAAAQLGLLTPALVGDQMQAPLS